jgi:DNA-binding transcriptional LysR family regulator
MPRKDFTDLLSFIAVAEAGSFTRAAQNLNVTQSALSHSVKGLEARLGVRLLARTTRSIGLTEPGEKILQNVAPKIREIDQEFSLFQKTLKAVSGTVKILASEHAARLVLWPRVGGLLAMHPAINLEVTTGDRAGAEATERHDLVISMARDAMDGIQSIPVTDDIKCILVATPQYLERRGTPSHPSELAFHECINLRRTLSQGALMWSLWNRDEAYDVLVEGQIVCEGFALALFASLSDLGIACSPLDLVRGPISKDLLRQVLKDWHATYPGYHVSYSTSRNVSPAASTVLRVLTSASSES